MNGLAMLYANEALRLANARAAELQLEAAHNRMGSSRPRWTKLRAIAAAISAMPASLTMIEGDRMVMPQLGDYPYRP